jgi:hypothetical protein
MARYQCKCGKCSTDDGLEFRKHLLEGVRNDGKGKHGKVQTTQTVPNVAETPASANDKSPGNQTAPVEPMLSPGMVAAAEEEEARILAEVKAREKTGGQIMSQEIINATGLKPQRQPFNKKRLLMLALGVLTGLIGGVLVAVWFANPRNQFVALLALGALAGSVYLIITQIRGHQDSSGGTVIVAGGTNKPPTGKINSLNIYGRKDPVTGTVSADRISFDWLDNPMGQPQQCLNTGKYYYVHWWNIEKKCLEPFILPDSKYTDPALLARYLELPAQRKYLKGRESLMKYIGPGILAALDCAGFIMIIILAG